MILLLILATAIALLAQWHVRRTYHRFSRIPTLAGFTGAEVAQRLLRSAGISDVSIQEHDALLGDHYDPVRKRLILSTANYHGTSIAAVGIAAHECGHAFQHQKGFAPLQWRMAAVSLASFASQMVLWLPVIGILTGHLSTYTGLLAMSVAWGVLMGFNLVTLPVEFDASRRAERALELMGLAQSQGEREGVNRVLTAAGWTYVAAFVTSLIYFLWYLLSLLAGRTRA